MKIVYRIRKVFLVLLNEYDTKKYSLGYFNKDFFSKENHLPLKLLQHRWGTIHLVDSNKTVKCFLCNKCEILNQIQLTLSHISFNLVVKYRGKEKKFSKNGFQSQPNLCGLHIPHKLCS